MKVVLLAGGMGSRISEESHLKPKPMIEIGEKPILWHIMKIYATYGFTEFIICCGYKGTVIKRYFVNYYQNASDVHIDLADETCIPVENIAEPWKVTMVDTGLHTLTAGRIKKIREYVGEAPFMMTYGDGVGNINIRKLLEFHQVHGRTATITAAKPAGRWGNLQMDERTGQVTSFREKSHADTAWVNAGFAVFNPEIFSWLGDGNSMLETEPYERLSAAGEMIAYRHEGFWHPMDTMRDKGILEQLWNEGNAPWKLWQ